jgi:hypothetical protein
MGVFTGIEPTWAAETNIGRTHIATKGVVQDGLVLNLDAGVSSSYPGSGTTWTDLSGNGNNGTLVNGVGFDSANGGSLDFEQTNTYADFGNILNFTTENFTFNTFLYLTSNTNTNNQNPILVYKGQFQANGYYIQFGGTSPAIVSFVTNQSGASQVTESSSSLVVGAWNCLSIVRNGSSVRIYVNAVDVTSTAGTHIIMWIYFLM